FSVVIMKSLATLDPDKGIDAMNAINKVILRTAFMPLFFVSSAMALLMVITGIWFWGDPAAARAVTGGLIYIFGMFVITAAANVPLNNALAQVSSHSQEAIGIWDRYLVRWTRWNTTRAMASVITLVICIDLLTL
ncbi:MAG: anthrone oxygenase family protein, partial [Pseudomonadota bacterium]